MSVWWVALVGLASIMFAMGLLVGVWLELGRQIKQLAEAQARLERGEEILLDLNAENRDLLERLKRS